MIIYIPSNAKLEVNKVDLRQPKINDLRNIAELSGVDELRKTQFVKMLVKDPDDIDKISLFDRDYLFTIAVTSLTLNRVNFSSKCSKISCGHNCNDFIDIGEVEPVFLNSPVELTRKFGDKEFTFRLLLVKDELDAIDYATIDDDDFEERKEDALVCRALSLEINDDNVRFVREDLDLAVYYAAQFFQICCPHGLNLKKDFICPVCGTVTTALLGVSGKMLDISPAVIMDRFASCSSRIDYNSFKSMTLPEYNFLIESLNAKKQ